ncbi:MAG: DMT family transporter [Microbacteriaceae bacterium]
MASTEVAPTAPPTPGVTPRVLVAIVITLLAWASAFVVIRGTAVDIGGGGLALARLVVGTILLGLVLIGRRWVRMTRREWLLVLGFGVLWFGGYNVALNIAEHTLDAGTTAMIINIGPILLALGAGIFLREGLPKWVVIGAGVAMVGVVLIGIGSGAQVDDGAAFNVGILWCLLAAFLYAAGVLLQKPALRRLPASQVTWLGCAIGMVACLPFSGQLLADLQTAPPTAIAGAIYLGAVPTALAFSTWAYALSRMPASQLGISTYLVPPIAIVIALLAFGDIPAPIAIVGGVICLTGVAITRRKSRPARPPVTSPGESLAE